MIKLKISDNETIEVDKAISNMVGLFKLILQDSDINEPIELQKVNPRPINY